MKTITFKKKRGQALHLLSMFESNSGALCLTGVRKYFKLPRVCTEFTLVFTKSHPHVDAYRIEIGLGECNWRVLMLDGYEPQLSSVARGTLIQLWHDGYNYVRCEVST